MGMCAWLQEHGAKTGVEDAEGLEPWRLAGPDVAEVWRENHSFIPPRVMFTSEEAAAAEEATAAAETARTRKHTRFKRRGTPTGDEVSKAVAAMGMTAGSDGARHRGSE